MTKIQATTRPDYLLLEIWIGIAKAAKKQELQEWAVEKPKFDSARKLRGLYFDPEDEEEYQETILKTRKTHEALFEAAMP